MHFEITAQQLSKFQGDQEVTFEEAIDKATFDKIKSHSDGTDIWRNDEVIRKGIGTRLIGAIIYELSEKKPIRILYDAIIEKGKVDLMRLPFQGLLMGVIIPFSENHATFFAPGKEIEVEEKSYFVAYGESSARFVFREGEEIHTKKMKSMGYSYGDRLKTDDFPFFYK